MLSAHELHRRGVEAVNHGRVRLAGRLLDRAASRTEDSDLLARIDVSRAYVALELGDLSTATRFCEQALARPALAATDRGVALSQLAMLQMRSGLLGQALESFSAGIGLLEDEPEHVARALGNRGDVHLQQQRGDAAAADFRAAAKAFGSAGMAVDRAKAEHNLGYALMLAGDLVGALAAMNQAASELEPVSPVLRAVCGQDRAEVLMAMGLHDEGAHELRRAARGFGARRLRQRQAEAELALARASVLRDPESAHRLATSARRRFDRLDLAGWSARSEAVALSADFDAGRATPKVIAKVPSVIGVLEAEGLSVDAAMLRLNRARGLLRLGQADAAGEAVVRLERRPSSTWPLALRLLEHEVRAEEALARDRAASALRHLRMGLADLHDWQSSFGSLDLQTNVVGHGVRLAVRGLELATDSRSPAVLFEWSERARMLASRIQPVRAPQDEQSTADLAELRAQPTPARERELRQRIRERAWQQRGSGEVVDPVSLPELRAALGDDTALTAYVVTSDRVVALVATAEGTRRHDLGDRAALDRLLGGLLADLDMAAGDLPAAFAAPVRTALAARLAALDDLLVAPLVRDLGDRRVVLTPSGVLAGVPWTLLPGLAGRPLTVAQSATSWLARRATPLRTATAGFVAGPRVLRAEAEVLAVAKEWGRADEVPVLMGPAARAEAVTDLAGRVDVLHVAAHGRHSAENPLFSGLELADGTWFGYDIDQVDAVPDVVLLSACEVGRSSVRWGEELIGMTAAWLHAGARCVLASPAAVNDEAAYDALVAVHAGLAAGLDPAAALARALAQTRGDAAPAPFVCFG